VNLYNVGDAVFPRGTSGQPGAALSGRRVAEDIQTRRTSDRLKKL